jgi:hypothetical protein
MFIASVTIDNKILMPGDFGDKLLEYFWLLLFFSAQNE